MTFADAYWRTVQVTRFLSLSAAFFIVVLLSLNFVDNLSYLIFDIPQTYTFWRETVLGASFAGLAILAFLPRFILLLSKDRKSLVRAQLMWIGSWGVLASWALATQAISGAGIFFSDPYECMHCNAFLGVPWRTALTFLLVSYFFLSPVRQLANPLFAWFWKQADTYG